MPIIDPMNLNGSGSLEQQLWSNPVPFKATATAIATHKVVSIGTTGLVAISATDGTPSLVVGITKEAIEASGTGNVIIQGIAENVACDGTVAAGDLLKRSVTTAGSVAATATPAEGEVIGVAINASASNVVDVWIGPAGGCGTS